MAGDMPATDADLSRPRRLYVDRDLTQTAFHPAREPKRDLTQSSAEMTKVELAVESLQPVEKSHISRARPLPTWWRFRC
jgi:hypothetical protein